MSGLTLLALLLAPPSHTHAACWTEPRLYHEPGAARIVTVARVAQPPAERLARSPNGAYGFELLSRPTTIDNPDADPARIDAELRVWQERPYLLQLQLQNIRAEPEVRWINEKLLYLRVWWGRILGSDLILDVEAERLIVSETVVYGHLNFQQAQAACRLPEWRAAGECRCYPEAPPDWRPEPAG